MKNTIFLLTTFLFLNVIALAEDNFEVAPSIQEYIKMDKEALAKEKEETEKEIQKKQESLKWLVPDSEGHKQATEAIQKLKEKKKNIEENLENFDNKKKELADKIQKLDNSREINTLSKQAANHENRISNLEKETRHLNEKINKATAMSTAMSNVDFPQLQAGDIGVAAGIGHCQNAQAVAVGVGYAISDDFRIHTKLSAVAGNSHYNTIGGGVSYRFRSK